MPSFRLAELACQPLDQGKIRPSGHGTVKGMGEQFCIERCGTFRPQELPIKHMLRFVFDDPGQALDRIGRRIFIPGAEKKLRSVRPQPGTTARPPMRPSAICALCTSRMRPVIAGPEAT